MPHTEQELELASENSLQDGRYLWFNVDFVLERLLVEIVKCQP